MAHPLVPSLVELGDAVSNNLAFAYRPNSRISFGEETITELNLLTLQQRHPGFVRIETFSKPAEVRNGSDWEWAIIGNQYTYRMRIQAKRINKNGALKGLHRQAKTATMSQMDALISGAKAEGIQSVYCFYSAEPHRTVWTASGKMCHAGCLIADAQQVKALTKQKFADVEEISVPWHFLFDEQIYELAASSNPSKSTANFGSAALLQTSSADPTTGQSQYGSIGSGSRENPFRFGDTPLGGLLDDTHDDPVTSEDLPTGLAPTDDMIISRVLRAERPDELRPSGAIILDFSDLGLLR